MYCEVKREKSLFFNVLDLKIEALISIIHNVFYEEFSIKLQEFHHFKTYDKRRIEFVDNLFPFFLLKYFVEENQEEDYEKIKLFASNFKYFKTATFFKFNNLDPNYSLKENSLYLNSTNFPKYFEFTPTKQPLKFETKLNRYQKIPLKDLTVSTNFDYKPNGKANLDDTLEFIRDEESFTFDNSMEIVKQIDKKNNYSEHSSISSIKSFKPNEPIVIKPSERKISKLKQFFEETPKKESEKKIEKSSKIAFSKKELRDLILKHGELVKEALYDEKREREKKEEEEKKEKMENYKNAMQINKILWYYYTFFPDKYPLVLGHYLDRLNKKFGLNDMFFPLKVNNNNFQEPPKTKDENERILEAKTKFLPNISKESYFPDFNQKISIGTKKRESKENSISMTRGRSHSKNNKKEKNKEKSLPTIKSNMNSKIYENNNNDSLLRGFMANKPQKTNNIPESVLTRNSKTNQSLPNIHNRNHSHSNILE